MSSSDAPGQPSEPTSEAALTPGSGRAPSQGSAAEPTDSSEPQQGSGSGQGGDAAPLALDPDRDLATVAVGASNVVLLGSLLNLGFGLFPLRLADTQWQLNQMSNLAANGTWILLALVLLHLGVRHQPSKGRWVLRLSFLRRLSVPLTLVFLLLVPLQLAITWQGLETARSGSDLALRRSLGNAAVMKRVIAEARDLKDLTRRVRAIPGAPPIPPEAASLPFETLRRSLLGQLDALMGSLRDRLAPSERIATEQTLWRQSVRTALTNLLLAFGFASVSRGEKNRSQLISLLLGLPRRLRRLSRRFGSTLAGARSPEEGSQQASNHGLRGGHRSASRRRRRRHGQQDTPTSAATQPSGGFGERWQRWKRRLRD